MILSIKEISGYQLWLAGEGDMEEELKILVSQNHLEDKVRFLGNIAPEQLSLIHI